MEVSKDMTGVTRELLSAVEKSVSFTGDAEGCITAAYVIERQYTFGTNSDTTVTVKYKPNLLSVGGQLIKYTFPSTDFEVEVRRTVSDPPNCSATLLYMGKGMSRKPICDGVRIILKPEKVAVIMQMYHFWFSYKEGCVTVELTPAEYHVTVNKIEPDADYPESWWLHYTYNMGNNALTGEGSAPFSIKNL